MKTIDEITMMPVESSNLLAIGYDAETQILYVIFKGNAQYYYEGVPSAVFKQLQDANSIGGYFAVSIRNRYKATKI